MTECTQTVLPFQPHFRQDVHVDFRGSRISSDGGCLLLRDVDRREGIIAAATQALCDYRNPLLIEHELDALVRQRVMGICLGYEDLNDHDHLQGDSLLALCAGRRDITGSDRIREADIGKPLASSSTLNRLELAVPAPGSDMPQTDRYHRITFDPVAGQNLFVDLYRKMHRKPPKRITLDIDATDNPLHGNQEGRFWHGHYDCYCYLPLYVFVDDHLLWAELQTADGSYVARSVEIIAHIVERLRSDPRWRKTQIVVRGDSGFGDDRLMSWCEAHNVKYVLGFQKNVALERHVEDLMEQNVGSCRETGEPVVSYRSFIYRTRNSWSRERRIVAKVEALPPPSAERDVKANHRFLVTNFGCDRLGSRQIYQDEYCPRGDMENRIKEQQLDLFADRTPTARIWSNQIRLWLASVAYVLMSALRRTALKRTPMASAQCGTIRERLLKIGAVIRHTTRRIYVHLSGAHPAEPVFRLAAQHLRQP